MRQAWVSAEPARRVCKVRSSALTMVTLRRNCSTGPVVNNNCRPGRPRPSEQGDSITDHSGSQPEEFEDPKVEEPSSTVHSASPPSIVTLLRFCYPKKSARCQD